MNRVFSCGGNVIPDSEDLEKEKQKNATNTENTYLDRSEINEMFVISEEPYCAETPGDKLNTFITPNELFFIRDNIPEPSGIDANVYKLSLSGIGVRPMTLSYEDIMKKYKKYSIEVTLHCVGNRRNEMTQIRPIPGLQWGIGGIGTALWSGAKLCEVLASAGFKEGHPDAHYVQLEALDTNGSAENYSASIPIHTAIDPKADVLLAYKMNNEQLSKSHGFPVRVIAPGIVGFRNVKYVAKIMVTEQDCTSQWQNLLYRMYLPNVTIATENTMAGPSVLTNPVNSVITNLVSQQIVQLNDGKLFVKGFACSGGGCMIIRVDVSADCGKTWIVANIVSQANTLPPYHWTWSLWETNIPIPPYKSHKVEIWVKAVDNAYNIQPEKMESIWNMRGVVCNAYHKIQVNIA